MDYHDALAILGVGSAHPGGFKNTLAWMDKVSFKEGARVLEVGCGTGRTACELSLRFGVDIVAVDMRQAMIDKAVERAKACGARVRFMRVKRGGLPFADGQYDALIAESVTLFNDVKKMLYEYHRVLASDGFILDTEMCAASLLPPEVFKVFGRTYGATIVPTMTQWKKLFTGAGFDAVKVLQSGPVTSSAMMDDVMDPWAIPSARSLPEEVFDVVRINQEVMEAHSKWLQFAVIHAAKRGDLDL